MHNPMPRPARKRQAHLRVEDCPILEEDDEFVIDALDTPESADFLAHDCGLDHLGQWSLPEEET